MPSLDREHQSSDGDYGLFAEQSDQVYSKLKSPKDFK
jgi:hypothetical protein